MFTFNFYEILKQVQNDMKGLFTTSWIIASLGQVAHFTSVVIRNVLATSGWVRSAHTAPYAKSAHHSLVKALAFTLAETLVVMGIIGVVAALTIPNLNQSTGDREKVAKLKKVYSNLNDAYGRATAVYGPIDEWFVNDSSDEARKRASERFTEFMKISKTCDDGTGCFSKDYTNELSYLLADGTSFTFGEVFDKFADAYIIGYNSIALILIDIDGLKGQNEFGKDIFIFAIYKDGLFPILSNQENSSYLFNIDVADEDFYLVAAAWIIKNGNMDYLKCPEELDWETKTSCK